MSVRHSFLRIRLFSSVAKIMEKESIIPDVIDTAPEEILEVFYPSGVSARLGNVLTPTLVRNPPFVKWNAHKNNLFTLCMTDPDAPTRRNPIYREWHHWLVGNIPGNNIHRGTVLSAYIGSGPPKDTGLHRYVFLLYQQISHIEFKGIPRLSDRSGDKRGGFSIRKFAKDFKLGQPIAGNFYLAEYDDYVPLLFKKLGV